MALNSVSDVAFTKKEKIHTTTTATNPSSTQTMTTTLIVATEVELTRLGSSSKASTLPQSPLSPLPMPSPEMINSKSFMKKSHHSRIDLTYSGIQIQPTYVLSEVSAPRSWLRSRKETTVWSQSTVNGSVNDVVKFSWHNKNKVLTITKVVHGEVNVMHVFRDAFNERFHQFTFIDKGVYTIKLTNNTNTSSPDDDDNDNDNDVEGDEIQYKYKPSTSPANNELVTTVNIRTPTSTFSRLLVRNTIFTIVGVLVLMYTIVFATDFFLSLYLGFNEDSDTTTTTTSNSTNTTDIEYTEQIKDALQDIVYTHTRIPLTLALLIIFLTPFYVLKSHIFPPKLTSFGRGYSYNSHVNVRLSLLFIACASIVTCMWNWKGYGDNGDSIELIMVEVADITTFVGEQLGAATSSLVSALNLTDSLPDDPSDLYGDVAYCPDASPEEEEFCAFQIDVFKVLAGALTGPSAIFKVDDDQLSLLRFMIREAANSKSYEALGTQLIASIMRVRMLLIYFILQISLISTSAMIIGAHRCNQHIIRVSGWFALFGLVVVLFSYSFNKPLAVVIDNSVTVMVEATSATGDSEHDENMPLMKLLAYCKPGGSEGASGSSSAVDLSFAGDLAQILNPDMSAASTPQGIKANIKLASKNLISLQAYFSTDPTLSLALSDGVLLLPIINGIFNAVGNVISIIDCEVAFQSFLRILAIFESSASESFANIANSELALAIMLALMFAFSRFGGHVLDRPLKLWFCAKTNRWFRFRCSYLAHLAVLKRHEHEHFSVHLANLWPSSLFGFCGGLTPRSLALEVATCYGISLVIMVPNAMMCLSGTGFRGVPWYLPLALLLTSLVGLTSTWDVGGNGGWARQGGRLGVLLALMSVLACFGAALENGAKVLKCAEDINAAIEESQDNAEGKSYVATITAAQREGEEDGKADCSFKTLSDYLQGMVFCIVMMFVTLLCFLSGLCFLCTRSHMITDAFRKSMLKRSASMTADGEMNNLVESMGGQRMDGLGTRRLKVQLMRLVATKAFRASVVASAAGGMAYAFAFVIMPSDYSADVFKYNLCGGETRLGECCNGLTSSCGKRIDEVTFAGVHNSFSNAHDKFLAPNNFFTQVDALNNGYRGMFMDLYMYDEDFNATTPNELYFCHGFCSFGKTKGFSLLNETNTWLLANPNEVVIFFFEDYPTTTAPLYGVFVELGWTDKLIVKNDDGTWPTLRSSLVSGKQIVMLSMQASVASCDGTTEHPRSGCPKGWYDAFEHSYDTPYNIQGAEEFDCSLLSRGNVDENSLFVVNHFITNPVASPSSAHLINWNPYIGERLNKCEEENPFKHRVNVISVDYWSIGQAVEASQENNLRV